MTILANHGKPGNVRDFDSCQRNVRDFAKSHRHVREVSRKKSCEEK